MAYIHVQFARGGVSHVLTPDGVFRLANPEAICPGRIHVVAYWPFDQFATIVAICIRQ